MSPYLVFYIIVIVTIFSVMSKIEKLIERLKTKPKDFRWDELTKVLKHYEFKEQDHGKTSGSRRSFSHKSVSNIDLHKPHPKPVVKHYQIKEVLEKIKEVEEL